MLRLVQGRGATLRVVCGRIWVTEEGCADDCFLGPGEDHRIAGDGLVLITAESREGDGPAAEIALRVPENAIRADLPDSGRDAAIAAVHGALSR